MVTEKVWGFPHAVCPKDSPYHDTNSCDRNENGPYSVQGYFLRQAVIACEEEKTCDEDEAERLSFIGTDVMDRVLSDDHWDPAPEGL